LVPGDPRQSASIGVGHPVAAVPDVRSPDARRRQYDLPDGIIAAFQVILYSVEPEVASRACNLLPTEAVRSALLDEAEPDGPEVAGVVKAKPLTGSAEGLAVVDNGAVGAVAFVFLNADVVDATNAARFDTSDQLPTVVPLHKGRTIPVRDRDDIEVLLVDCSTLDDSCTWYPASPHTRDNAMASLGQQSNTKSERAANGCNPPTCVALCILSVTVS
jgi:hypothetical protein